MPAKAKQLITTDAPETFKGKDRTYYITSWENLGSVMYSVALYYCPRRQKHYCVSSGYQSKQDLIKAWSKDRWINQSGLLEPNGKFHPCFYAQHLTLVSYLSIDGIDDWEPLVSRRNWLHLSDGEWSWCNKITRKQ